MSGRTLVPEVLVRMGVDPYTYGELGHALLLLAETLGSKMYCEACPYHENQCDKDAYLRLGGCGEVLVAMALARARQRGGYLW